jgi:hypothetical protein
MDRMIQENWGASHTPPIPVPGIWRPGKVIIGTLLPQEERDEQHHVQLSNPETFEVRNMEELRELAETARLQIVQAVNPICKGGTGKFMYHYARFRDEHFTFERE